MSCVWRRLQGILLSRPHAASDFLKVGAILEWIGITVVCQGCGFLFVDIFGPY